MDKEQEALYKEVRAEQVRELGISAEAAEGIEVLIEANTKFWREWVNKYIKNNPSTGDEHIQYAIQHVYKCATILAMDCASSARNAISILEAAQTHIKRIVDSLKTGNKK